MIYDVLRRPKDMPSQSHENGTPEIFEPQFREPASTCRDLCAQSDVLGRVRRGEISRARAAEILQIPFHDLPQLLASHGIPWFDEDSLGEEGVEVDGSRRT